MENKFILNKHTLKNILEKKGKTILIKIENNLKEETYLSFLSLIIEDLNQNCYNLITKKKIKKFPNTENIDKLLINNRPNILSRDCKLQLIFKDVYANYKDIEKSFDKLKKGITSDSSNFAIEINEDNYIYLNKNIQIIYILDDTSRLFSKKLMDRLIEEDLIEIFTLSNIDFQSEIIFYKNNGDT